MENSTIMKKKTRNLSLNSCMSYLHRDLFLACFVYLVLSPQKILYLTSNIKNLIFF
jgi:hypothetical protein